eukprot:CAMPEP_0182419886 /NCGR_PEP_ID=MMETSP1167-20130531/4230_1 /TAXON_ID=2988 /ORGANISM="Mallomonas Sp, Strain CCMP3275" /LENGTH=378 /DNA_ID=CAMNT_0024595027 /DNA_START=91 /DNA_END=1227 /DNA_ORIENTATION=+
MERSLNMHDMDSTYRQEGVSVSHTHMRIEGEEIYMSVHEKDLIVEKRIGQGACSAVFRARHKRHGEKYALKMFNVFDRERRQQLQSEIRMLSRIQCDSLIAFYGAYLKEGNIVIILEYMDRGSLEFIKNPDVQITEEAMAGISYQIMWGLAYLHFEHKIHRDIKPGNVLINSKGAVKLSDFGISRDMDSTSALTSTSVGTFKYMSHDRLMGGDYDTSSDLWSVGIMLIELWEKKYPFEECSSSPIELVQIIEENKNLKDHIVHKSKYKPEMRQFVQSLVELKPSRRATASDCLTSPWFTLWSLDSLDAAQEATEAWIQTLGSPEEQSIEEDDYDDEDELMSMSISGSMNMNKPRYQQEDSYDDEIDEGWSKNEGKFYK